jgi:hypothetical protein
MLRAAYLKGNAQSGGKMVGIFVSFFWLFRYSDAMKWWTSDVGEDGWFSCGEYIRSFRLYLGLNLD